jgi:hypothetical protein
LDTDTGVSSNDAEIENASAEIATAPHKKPTYWLTRFIILRWLGFVYFFTFLSAAKQIVPLVGSHVLNAYGWQTDTNQAR